MNKALYESIDYGLTWSKKYNFNVDFSEIVPVYIIENNYNFDILRKIAKQKNVRIIDLIDTELKKPIINGETTITRIIPDPTSGKFNIYFN